MQVSLLTVDSLLLPLGLPPYTKHWVFGHQRCVHRVGKDSPEVPVPGLRCPVPLRHPQGVTSTCHSDGPRDRTTGPKISVTTLVPSSRSSRGSPPLCPDVVRPCSRPERQETKSVNDEKQVYNGIKIKIKKSLS